MAVFELAAAVKQRVLLNDASSRSTGRRSPRPPRRSDRPPLNSRPRPQPASPRECAPRTGAPLALAIAAGLAACFSAPPRPAPAPRSHRAAGAAGRRAVPDSVPDAVPRIEPRSRTAIRRSTMCSASATTYCPRASATVERGVASWYGPGFHKVRTSTGEPYDMYAMTAAHKTLPLARLRARHEFAERPQHRGARQRSRSVRRQSHHRSLLHRGSQARHVAQRYRHGRGSRRSTRRRPPVLDRLERPARRCTAPPGCRAGHRPAAAAAPAASPPASFTRSPLPVHPGRRVLRPRERRTPGGKTARRRYGQSVRARRS